MCRVNSNQPCTHNNCLINMSIHHIRTKFGDRTFSVASPTVRNSLPESVRSAETLASSSASWKPNLLLSFINIVTPSRSVVGWALNYPRIVLSCVISSKKIQGNDRQQLRQKYAMKLIWGPIFNKWWNQSYTIFVLILRPVSYTHLTLPTKRIV